MTTETSTDKNDASKEEKQEEDLAKALQETLHIKNDDNRDNDKDTKTKTRNDSPPARPPAAALSLSSKQNQEEQIKAWRDAAPKELITVADWMTRGQASRILVLTGAGLSVAAGIPDFRTPGTGLYDNLQKYNLPFPEAVFDLHFYRRNPAPFCRLAKELWPGVQFVPTVAHAFLTLLHRKGYLLRCYTQNIDGLEHLAKLPADALVECHGHFRTASCIECGKAADGEVVKHQMVTKQETPKCQHCRGYVKPDIVFFGEGLPDRFHSLLHQDLPVADACLILGTSLAVAPVSAIPEMVRPTAKRILLNRELVGNINPRKRKTRDVFHGADCDESVEWLAKLLGWWPELQALHADLRDEFAAASQTESMSSTSTQPKSNSKSV